MFPSFITVVNINHLSLPHNDSYVANIVYHIFMYTSTNVRKYQWLSELSSFHSIYLRTTLILFYIIHTIYACSTHFHTSFLKSVILKISTYEYTYTIFDWYAAIFSWSYVTINLLYSCYGKFHFCSTTQTLERHIPIATVMIPLKQPVTQFNLRQEQSTFSTTSK